MKKKRGEATYQITYQISTVTLSDLISQNVKDSRLFEWLKKPQNSHALAICSQDFKVLEY